ncbi:hypothetical protein [Micromonospora rubida]|uniref:hypothetical protein n=1 Tax=Micromonospora rubida TaxID=2697657 RepID=UPI001377C42D|nr:hypothetical protein [Micromonospora rubida]NBE80330.1 hypothetical protein [Micromonospora rubida]
MTPHHLHALAAAYSLAAALGALESAAKASLADAVNGNRSGEISIPSQQFGRRHGLGGHGDPTADLAIGAWAPSRPDPHAEALGGILRALDPLAGLLPGAPGMDPLTRIRHAIPSMSPHAAERTAEALAVLDRSARRTLGPWAPPSRAPLRGPIPPTCPACRCRATLHIQTAGPEADWTVVCDGSQPPGQPHQPCLCTGPGCPCGMEGAVAGVVHIWPRYVVLGAVGGAR